MARANGSPGCWERLDGEGRPAGADPRGLRSLRVLFTKPAVSQETVSCPPLRLQPARVNPPPMTVLFPVFEALLNQPQVREAGKPQVLMRAGLWGLPCRKPGKGLAGGCPVPAQQWAWLHFISLFVP